MLQCNFCYWCATSGCRWYCDCNGIKRDCHYAVIYHTPRYKKIIHVTDIKSCQESCYSPTWMCWQLMDEKEAIALEMAVDWLPDDITWPLSVDDGSGTWHRKGSRLFTFKWPPIKGTHSKHTWPRNGLKHNSTNTKKTFCK